MVKPDKQAITKNVVCIFITYSVIILGRVKSIKMIQRELR